MGPGKTSGSRRADTAVDTAEAGQATPGATFCTPEGSRTRARCRESA